MFQCRVCLQCFKPKGALESSLLPCAHTVCLRCLKRALWGEEITCTECGTTHAPDAAFLFKALKIEEREEEAARQLKTLQKLILKMKRGWMEEEQLSTLEILGQIVEDAAKRPKKYPFEMEIEEDCRDADDKSQTEVPMVCCMLGWTRCKAF